MGQNSPLKTKTFADRVGHNFAETVQFWEGGWRQIAAAAQRLDNRGFVSVDNPPELSVSSVVVPASP